MSTESRARLRYSKLCEVEDFGAPEICRLIREIYPPSLAEPESFPVGREYRKHWEVAQAARAFRDFSVLGPQAETLGVGAGAEQTTFWLTNHVRRVFATDLYGASGGWDVQCPKEMLTDPAQFCLGNCDLRRLVVQHMDGRELRFENESFDGVYSSNSIEHFGDADEISLAAREMARVLRPGGIAAISTEFRITGPRSGLPGTFLFDEEAIHDVIIEPACWELVDGLDLRLSEQTRASVVPFASAAADVAAASAAADVATGRTVWTRYPHILLSHEGHLWTSVSLTLRKKCS